MGHPFLTWCEGDEVARRIAENETWLERACQQDYDAEVPRRCRELGLARSYAVIPRVKADPQVQRGNLMRALGLEVG